MLSAGASPLDGFDVFCTFAWARKASFLAIVHMVAALHLTLRRCLLPMLNICAEGAREARWAVLAEAKGLAGDGRACAAGGRLATTLRRVWRRRQGQAQMRVALVAWVAAAAWTRTPARSSAQVVARALGARPMCIAAGGSGFTRRGTDVHVGKSLYELPRTSGRLGWRVKVAQLSKLSPAWASRPGVRRAVALSTLLISVASPRRRELCIATCALVVVRPARGSDSPYAGSARSDAPAFACYVPAGAPCAALAGTLGASSPVGALAGSLSAAPLRRAPSPLCSCSGVVIVRSCVRALSQRLQGTCDLLWKRMMSCVHLAAPDPSHFAVRAIVSCMV